MFKRSMLFSLIFGLFFLLSCHHIGKKSCCGKRAHAHKSGHDYGEKPCSSCDKKGKKHCSVCSKKSKGKWDKKGKSCCGKPSVAGQAFVKAVNGSKITGKVFFERVERHKVKVTANIKGLKAKQKFGFHVHEFGHCADKALTAGGHLNPWGAKHAGSQDKERHHWRFGQFKL